MKKYLKIIVTTLLLLLFGGVTSTSVKATMSEGSSVNVVKTKVSSEKVYNKFAGYSSYTPGWYRASQYTISTGKSMSASTTATYNGTPFTLSYSFTQSVGITIPADKSRDSRLGIWVDTTLTKYKVVTYSYNRVVSTQYTVQSSVFNYHVRPAYYGIKY